jgi:hypothetical protein
MIENETLLCFSLPQSLSLFLVETSEVSLALTSAFVPNLTVNKYPM